MPKHEEVKALRDIVWYGTTSRWAGEELLEKKLADERGKYLILTEDGQARLRALFMEGY